MPDNNKSSKAKSAGPAQLNTSEQPSASMPQNEPAQEKPCSKNTELIHAAEKAVAQEQSAAAQKKFASPQYAGFFPRFMARLIDCFLAMIPGFVLTLARLALSVGSSGSILALPALFSYSIFDIVKYLLFVSYFILFTGFTGTTAGKRAMHIRVVDMQGQKLGWLIVIYRETIGRYLTSLLWVGYLFLACDKQHRGFHDMLSDTRVIYDFD